MAQADEKVQTHSEEVEDFATMLEESFKESNNSVLNGVIVEIKDSDVYVDIDKKQEAILSIEEIQDEEGKLLFNTGDEIEVAITGNRSGKTIVSHKKALRKKKVKDFIANYVEDENAVYDVKIIAKNRGGFVCVDENGIEFFLPRSQSAFRDLNHVVGKNFKVKIIKINKEEQNIVVSRKRILDDERRKRKEIIASIMEKDEIIEGIIKKITSYGMFVDVGGVDGLVHYSEISYKGPVNPSSMYNEGETVPVKIINYDKEKRHLSLSIKAALPDPWDEMKDNLEAGDTIQVTVSNIEPYGAFVDLGNDVEGFLHISEISWNKNVKDPRDYIEIGQELEVEVIELNSEQRRLRVSLKNLLEKPFDAFAKKHRQGEIVKGKITTITAFGAFVRIDDVEGLLHNEDASWDRNVKCKELFNVGDELELKITKIDKQNQKISLNTKELQDSPVQEYAKAHHVDEIVKAKIKDIKDFGIFVELSPGVDALIHKEDMGSFRMDEAKPGDEVEALIIMIDERRNRVRLSIKGLSRKKERDALHQYNDRSDDKLTLGDLIKDQLK